MQAFTDLVGTSAVPTHCFDIAELTDLTPALDPAMAAHDTADQGAEAVSPFTTGNVVCLDQPVAVGC
jgi:hypothetical protein